MSILLKSFDIVNSSLLGRDVFVLKFGDWIMKTESEIVEEIKANIHNDKFTKAASYLDIISERFGDKALKAASDNYIQFVREAAIEKKKESVYGFFTNANVGFRD